MKQYLIEFSWLAPYPKKAEYRLESTSWPVAIAKASRQFRKDTKGQRIKSAVIKFQHYATIQKDNGETV